MGLDSRPRRPPCPDVPGPASLVYISALRASSAMAAGTPRAKSPPPRFSAFHPAHVVASQSLEPCTKSYRAPAQAYISRSIVAQVAHIAHTSSRSRQPPTPACWARSGAGRERRPSPFPSCTRPCLCVVVKGGGRRTRREQHRSPAPMGSQLTLVGFSAGGTCTGSF